MNSSPCGNVVNFGACKPECDKGEPIELKDGRFLQANLCPNGNACVLVGETALLNTTSIETKDFRTPASTVYTREELREIGEGNHVFGVGKILSQIARNPSVFIKDTDKPF